MKSAHPEILVVVKLKKIRKKKVKTEVLTKCLSLKNNSIRIIHKVYKTPMLLFVAIELIRSGKQKFKILTNIIKNILSK